MTAVFKEVELRDICELKYGKSLRQDQRSGSGYPVFGSNGEIGRHDSAITDGPTIIVGRKGSFGEVAYSDESCWPIDTTYFIDRGATDADLRWLYHRLAGLPLKDLNRAAAVPGLNREDAYSLRLLLPPIECQQRIARILDVADALRAKRRQATAKRDELTETVFRSLFLGETHDAWPSIPIAELAAPQRGAIRTGPFGSQLLHSEFTESGIAVLGIDNAVQNRFAWDERRYISEEKYEELRRYTAYSGDVIITIMGTTGRVAVVPDDIPLAITTKHLCCITLDLSKCLPFFLWGSIRFDPETRRQLGATQGAVMPGLNMGKIKRARIRIPPIDTQLRFVEALATLHQVSDRSERSEMALDELYASLQRRAYRGDL